MWHYHVGQSLSHQEQCHINTYPRGIKRKNNLELKMEKRTYNKD